MFDKVWDEKGMESKSIVPDSLLNTEKKKLLNKQALSKFEKADVES